MEKLRIRLGDVVSFNYRDRTTGQFKRRIVSVRTIVCCGQLSTVDDNGEVYTSVTDNADRLTGYVLSEGIDTIKSFRVDRMLSYPPQVAERQGGAR